MYRNWCCWTDWIDFLYLLHPDDDDDEVVQEGEVKDDNGPDGHGMGRQGHPYNDQTRQRYLYDRIPDFHWAEMEGLQMLLYFYDKGFVRLNGSVVNMKCSGCSHGKKAVFFKKGEAVGLLAEPFKKHGSPRWVHLKKSCFSQNSQIRDLSMDVATNAARGKHVIHANETNGNNDLKDRFARALNLRYTIDNWAELLEHLKN